MKIEKTVDETGRIDLKITDVPKLPAGTRIHGPGYVMLADGSIETKKEVEKMQLGDFAFHPRSLCCSVFQKTDSAERIASALEGRFKGFFDGLEKFREQHNETAEILSVPEAAQKLYDKGALYYRASNGQIKKVE